MKKLTALLLICWLLNTGAQSQGCIAIRNISGFGQYNLTDNAFATTDWQLNITTRYFKSFRDFKETVDQKTPEQNESVVKSYSMDISISRLMRDGWSLNLSLPISSNSREASLEHGGPNTTRHTTNSFGIGDIRFTVYKWLLSPTVKQKGNIQLGLGLKLPTGDYKYQDHFYRNDSTKLLSAVNPSIQLGDGGTGIITELNLFYFLNAAGTISLYGNFYYMVNPREQNGTAITNGRIPSRIDSLANNIIMSVPDQFSMRVGAYYNLKNWAFSAGIRNEGSPVEDLVGDSEGVRRAGHNLSVEPGIIYKMKKASIYAYVPIIVERKISQNVPDKFKSRYTGIKTVSPGGSGNYQVFAGVLFKL
ncbi:hypothetical protein [Terrimonas pollutisoli]|uniref:hypothetical protein n=1 Tax=Terrimonas pollutisoli TaxID=3034147 RepID=UPI0023ECDFDD|nr:hypothetical protein [Terrimonas sp. H1YJ31]